MFEITQGMIGELALVSATTGLMLEIVEYNYMFFCISLFGFVLGLWHATHTHPCTRTLRLRNYRVYGLLYRATNTRAQLTLQYAF